MYSVNLAVSLQLKHCNSAAVPLLHRAGNE